MKTSLFIYFCHLYQLHCSPSCFDNVKGHTFVAESVELVEARLRICRSCVSYLTLKLELASIRIHVSNAYVSTPKCANFS